MLAFGSEYVVECGKCGGSRAAATDGIHVLEHLRPNRLSARGKRLRGERRLDAPMRASNSGDVDECASALATADIRVLGRGEAGARNQARFSRQIAAQ